MSFDFDSIKDLLACPQSKSPLVMEENALVCVDSECRLRFEIRDDIPNLLVEKADQLSVEDWGEIMRRQGRDPSSGNEL